MDGYFKVTGTAKLQSGKTVFVVEPESEKEQAARVAAERAEAEAAAKGKAGDAAFAKFEAEQAAKKTAIAAAKKKHADDARSAEGLVSLAKQSLKDGKPDKAIERLQKAVAEFPDTPAAKEAGELLKKLEAPK